MAATKIYVKANDAYAYADGAKTVKIPSANMKDLFEKGMVLIDGVTEYKPVGFALVETVGTLTYVKTDADTATTAVLATLQSKEYSAQ